MKAFLVKYQDHFVFRATLLLVLYFGFYYSPWMQNCDAFLTENTANASAWVLQLGWDIPASVNVVNVGYKWHVIAPGKAGVHIAHPCNAFELYCLYVGFIVAVSGIAVSRKMWFALLGALAIYVFNVMRVVGLFLISGRWPQFFDFMHKYLFQTSAYVLMFGLWFWLLRKNKNAR